jgi:hypothetical protein
MRIGVETFIVDGGELGKLFGGGDVDDNGRGIVELFGANEPGGAVAVGGETIVPGGDVNDDPGGGEVKLGGAAG